MRRGIGASSHGVARRGLRTGSRTSARTSRPGTGSCREDRVSKKQYDGYRSYSYLKAGEDYQDIPLAKEIGRVPSAAVELGDAEEKRARAILDRHPVVSMHDHTSIFPEDMGRVLEQRRQGRDATGYAGLAASDTDVVFENFMDGTATITSNKGWKWDDILFDLGMRFADIDHQGMVYIARTYGDLEPAKAQGRIAFVPWLEASTSCTGSACAAWASPIARRTRSGRACARRTTPGSPISGAPS